MKEMTVTADVKNIEKLTEFVNAELEALGCSPRAQIQIDVAIDELFGNIAHYAYGSDGGEATVRFEAEQEPLTAVITFIDRGKPFDPLQKEDPDTTLSVKERQIGGLGIFLVKKTMDGMAYQYCDGQNMLTIRKKLR